MKLRYYQQRVINDLYKWFESSNEGNPCIVMPTGSGKSHVIAALCKDILQKWPDQKILMLTHVKELIEQNSEKMREHWPNAPMGIYSASIGKKNLGEPITFAGIQSIWKKAEQVGHIDVIIIDEAHLVGHKDQGCYRKFIADLEKINPALRIIGLSATPYRLGHGLIIDKPAIFDALIDVVGIDELINASPDIGGPFLANLRSKVTKVKLDTEGVHKRGGEFIESELQAAVDDVNKNHEIVQEIIDIAGDRKAWLFFCTGVAHAIHMKEALLNYGIPAECVTGATPKKEREKILDDFKSGKLRALTNANVLTTGFDYPDIDLIAMLRPTMSPGLYVQMAGRGMRLKSHTDHCLVLDFAGVVEMHGSIRAVRSPMKKGDGNGEAPVKVCQYCNELVGISATVCPACGKPFPEKKEKLKLHLRDDDIMGYDNQKIMKVTDWKWRKHVSRSSGKAMLAVSYYGGLADPPITEYFTILHDGYSGKRAQQDLSRIALKCNVDSGWHLFEHDLDEMAFLFNRSKPPASIEYETEGKFHRIFERTWS
jgi:DNA repair protein RadD